MLDTICLLHDLFYACKPSVDEMTSAGRLASKVCQMVERLELDASTHRVEMPQLPRDAGHGGQG